MRKQMTNDVILLLPKILCNDCARRFKELLDGKIAELTLCDDCSTKYRTIFEI